MEIFGNDKHARGCFVEISKIYSQGGQSAITGSSMRMTFPSGNKYPDNGTEPYFISSVRFAQKEKYHLVQCFNDTNYVYAFGHDPQASLLEVTYTMFMTDPSGTSFGASLSDMTGAYAGSRLSKIPENFATLTISNNFTMQGFIVGMDTSTVDQEHNIQQFVVLVLLVTTQGTAPLTAAQESSAGTGESGNQALAAGMSSASVGQALTAYNSSPGITMSQLEAVVTANNNALLAGSDTESVITANNNALIQG